MNNIKFLKTAKLKQYLAAFAVMFAITACDDSGILPVFQPSYDVELGQQVDTQIRANPQEYPLLNNSAANQYLQNIIDEIIKSSEIKHRDDFVYKVEIINSDVINAFATPGGYIYVYTGLIKQLGSEAEMAAILGHEISHADNRHSVSQMQKDMGIDVLVDIFLGNNQSELIQLATSTLSNVASMQFSQSDEMNADEYSFKYLKSINKWYPGAAKDFFQRMLAAGNGSSTFVDDFLSSHPTDQKRIDNIDKLLKDNNIPAATDENMHVTEYTTFKNSI